MKLKVFSWYLHLERILLLCKHIIGRKTIKKVEMFTTGLGYFEHYGIINTSAYVL